MRTDLMAGLRVFHHPRSTAIAAAACQLPGVGARRLQRGQTGVHRRAHRAERGGRRRDRRGLLPIRDTDPGVGQPVRALDLPFATQAGPQLVQDSTAPVRAPDLDALVARDGAHDSSAGHAADARLGVYLHMLADRISHHVCADRSVISGPSASGFFVDLTNRECAQPIHLLRHAWETGVDYARLLPQDRTTLAMLQSVYHELVAFARARGVLRAGADLPASQAAYTGELALALQKFQAADRAAAIDAAGCARGLALTAPAPRGPRP